MLLKLGEDAKLVQDEKLYMKNEHVHQPDRRGHQSVWNNERRKSGSSAYLGLGVVLVV